MERLDCDRMFVAVLDSGSFSKAARALGTSSGQASKLGADLGVHLLNRTTRALSAGRISNAPSQYWKIFLARMLPVPGIRETVSIDHIKPGYYPIKALNPNGIVPVAPDLAL